MCMCAYSGFLPAAKLGGGPEGGDEDEEQEHREDAGGDPGTGQL